MDGLEIWYWLLGLDEIYLLTLDKMETIYFSDMTDFSRTARRSNSFQTFLVTIVSTMHAASINTRTFVVRLIVITIRVIAIIMSRD